MYMFVQIAVTMALDLEMEVKETLQSSAENQRTFVGVYYLSSAYVEYQCSNFSLANAKHQYINGCPKANHDEIQ